MNNSRLFTTSFFSILIIGLIVSALSAWNLTIKNNRTTENAAKNTAESIATDVLTRINLYQYGLRGARGAVITAGESGLTRELFKRYSLTRDINTEFPGARGFGFIRRVSITEEADFLINARRDGKPDFAIRTLTQHEGDRYVIQYIEPAERNQPAIGLDIASEKNRREAAIAAMRTGTVQLTGPITLVQARGNPLQSFLILMPIYREGKIPTTIAERETELFGWSYAPLSMSDVLTNLSIDKNLSNLTLQDITHAKQPEIFYKSHDTLPSNSQLFTQRLERNILGRKWQLEFSVNQQFIAQLHLTPPINIFLTGVFISVLLGILVGSLAVQRQREKKLVSAQAQLAAIVQSSIDGIIGKDLNGIITSWNTGAEKIFGYTATEAIGKSVASLIVPPELQHEEIDILARIAQGKHIPHFNTTRQKRDGSKIPISVAIAPIRNEGGEVIGASKTVRDITEQKAAEERIVDLNLNLVDLNLNLEAEVYQRTMQLDLARRNLQTVLDAVPSMIGYWDKHLINRVANHAYHDWFGVDANTIPGKHIKEVIGEKLFEANRELIEAALRGEPQSFTRAIPKPDGSGIRHSLAHYLPDINDGEVQGFYVIVHDVSDITEANQRLENALRENQALLTTLNQQMLYSVMDINGTIIDVNDNFCKTSGYSRDELIGQNYSIVKSDIHPIEYWQDLRQTISSGKPWHGEMCNRAKDGELRWFDAVIAPFHDANGKVERYVSLNTDITERKQAEVERNRVSLLLSKVLSAASEVSIIATDLEGTIIIFNTGAERMLGYSADEIVGKHTPGIFHLPNEIIERGKKLSAEYGEEIKNFRVFVHKPELDGSETRNWTYIRKDGSHIQVSLSATAIRDNDGNLTGYLGIATDVTQELQHKRDLKSTIDQLGIASDMAKLGVWTWDLKDNSLLWNERMFEMYSQPLSLHKQGLEYQHWYERVHPEDVDATAASLTAAVEGRGIYNPVFRILTPNGEVRHIQAAAQVEYDEAGKARKVTGINRDITAQLKFEITLTEAKEQADAANAAKSSFLANMSHEIRTPMNAVLGMLQLLQQTHLNFQQQDYVNKTQTAAKSLLGLLNDILDFSKIDAGKLQLDVHPFDVDLLIRDLAVILSGNQTNKDVEIIFDVDPSLPKTVIGDRMRLQQILINLAGNALKFTHHGHIIVKLIEIEKTASSSRIQIAISDTGIGINSEHLERIFEGFVQAETSTTRRFGGTGLGLVISKRLVDLMGGNLQVESQFGQGSRFWFELTLKAGDAPLQHEPDTAPSISNLHVLVIDDNPVSRDVLARTINHIGSSADQIDNGLEAVEILRNAEQENNGYDIVFVDWKMPVINGLKTAKLIHDIPSISKPPAVIMMAAVGRENIASLRNINEPLYTTILNKPATPQQVAESLRYALKGSTPINTPQSMHQHPLAGLKLLVVEDNELNRQVAFELLTHAGAQVQLAEGGVEGVEIVLSAHHIFDVILMDVQMPDIDGMEATRRIRADARFQALPIIAITANASQADKEICLRSGMNDHIGKPFDISEIVTLILKLAGRLNLQLTHIEQPALKKPASDVEELTVVINRFGGKLELYERMLTTLYPTLSKALELLKSQSAEQNFIGATATLHSIKGVASTMGAIALAARASELEISCKSSDNNAKNILFTNKLFKELQNLLNTSIAKLSEQFKKYKVATPIKATSLKILSHEDWKKNLASILPLLESDNLSALDKLEELYISSGSTEKQKMNELINQANALNYDEAIRALTDLLEGN